MSATSSSRLPVVQEVEVDEQSEISPQRVQTVVPPPVPPTIQELQQELHQMKTTIGLLVEVIRAGLNKEDEAPAPDDKVNAAAVKVDVVVKTSILSSWKWFIIGLIFLGVVPYVFVNHLDSIVAVVWAGLGVVYKFGLRVVYGFKPIEVIPVPVDDYKQVLYFVVSLLVSLAAGYNAMSGGADGPAGNGGPLGGNDVVDHFLTH
jgi:hypothetical protein